MKENGIGSTVDILSLTVLISIACLLLIGGIQHRENKNPRYAGEVAQNTLLIFQKVPVQELEQITYKPKLPLNTIPTRNLKNKPFSKIIKEEILLNPKWKTDNLIITYDTNKEFSRSLEKTLENSLNVLIGKKFDYRLTIQMKPFRVSKNTQIFYRNEIETVSKNSRKICSRKIKLYFSIPQNWQEKEHFIDKEIGENNSAERESENFADNFSKSELSRPGNMVPIYLTLEVWSK